MDLSADLLNAPHVRSVIERFPVVATFEEAPVAEVKGASGKTGIIIAVLLVAGVLVWLLLG